MPPPRKDYNSPARAASPSSRRKFLKSMLGAGTALAASSAALGVVIADANGDGRPAIIALRPF